MLNCEFEKALAGTGIYETMRLTISSIRAAELVSRAACQLSVTSLVTSARGVGAIRLISKQISSYASQQPSSSKNDRTIHPRTNNKHGWLSGTTKVTRLVECRTPPPASPTSDPRHANCHLSHRHFNSSVNYTN